MEYSYNPAPDLAPLPKAAPETFMGFRRKDGRAAIRNEIWIIPTVGCVNDIAKKTVSYTHLEAAADWVKQNAREGDLVITLGCGDIYKASKMMVADNK